MKLYSENEFYKLYQGNMLDMLEVIEPNSIDSITTDPPYELNFMSKGWDNAGVSFQADTWRKCYEVLKPGGYLLAFGGSRTFHRIACAIEDAGFEIRDTIMYLYGQGFPKSMSLSKQFEKKNDKENALKWKNWGTALKPSYESVIVARKPFKGSLVDNVIEYGVGGINIDECRVEIDFNSNGREKYKNTIQKTSGIDFKGTKKETQETPLYNNQGRFPANTILTYDETDFDEVCGGFPYTNSGKMKLNSEVKRKGITEDMPVFNSKNCGIDVNKATGLCSFGDSGSASRYFYCAKASKRDRDEGLDEFEDKPSAKMFRTANNTSNTISKGFERFDTKPSKNTHPTVKPTTLMQYLVRLVTPNGGTVLDPFNGSGSTGKAVMYENKERNKNYKYIGIELTEEYLPISKARIEYVCNLIEEEKRKDKQLTIFEVEK